MIKKVKLEQKMKILITYYSDTGNTEKIAKAIRDALAEHDVDLMHVKDANPETLKAYDLIFLGSGIYAFNVHRKVKTLIKKAPQLPSKFAFFYTHESKNSWPDAFKSVTEILDKTNSEILGEFDCTGENLVPLAAQQREAMLSRLSPEDRQVAEETYLNFVKGHPNEEDFEAAKKFAISIVNKL